MAKFFDEYFLPPTFDDALELLARYEGRARVIAGGTDLLLNFQSDYIDGHRPALRYAALIDITRIAGANEIREQDGYVVIGCAVTHTQVCESPLIQARATALAEASGVVGGPQVRNVATLVGNVAHALPAADGTIALMALGAEVQVQSPKSKVPSPKSQVQSPEWQPLASLFRGPGESAVDSTREIIAAVRFKPTRANEASAFARVMRPQGVALPILGMAVRLEIRDWRLEIGDVAICAGPVAPIPFRAARTEEFLRGKVLSDEVMEQAARVLVEECQPRTSKHRATKEYRVELLPVLLRMTLTVAAGRVANRKGAKSAKE